MNPSFRDIHLNDFHEIINLKMFNINYQKNDRRFGDPEGCYRRTQKSFVHWGVYKMGQKKFDTNVNKRREISEKKFSFRMKNTGDV